MKPPFVIHVSEMDHYPDAVYIGRGMPRQKLRKSKWHNPFKITEHVTRDVVIEGYTDYMRRGSGRHLQNDLQELTGKPLVCWCRHAGEEAAESNACHGDVLIQLWQEMVGKNR